MVQSLDESNFTIRGIPFYPSGDHRYSFSVYDDIRRHSQRLRDPRSVLSLPRPTAHRHRAGRPGRTDDTGASARCVPMIPLVLPPDLLGSPLQEVANILIGSWREGFVQVSGFVGATILLFSLVQFRYDGRITKWLEENEPAQPLAGALLRPAPRRPRRSWPTPPPASGRTLPHQIRR